MASQLALNLVPTCSPSSPLFTKQKIFMDMTIDCHMCIATRITDEAAMYIDSPSEPVLAIAALLYMLFSDLQEDPLGKLQLDMYSHILESFVQRCLLDLAMVLLKGTYGELASSLAFIVACDATKHKWFDDLKHSCKQQSLKPPTQNDFASIIGQAVPLEAILAGLADLDQDHLAQLRQHIQDVYDSGLRNSLCAMQPQSNVINEKLPAWTNFTHFDVLPEEITEITPEYLWYCWKHSVALQMAHSQHGIDSIIPVFMGHLDQPFAKADGNDDRGDDCASHFEMHTVRYMTYVAWEAKNQLAPQTTETDPRKVAKLTGPIITRTSMAPAQEPLTPHALISVLLDLGTKVSFGDTPWGLQPQFQPIMGQQCPWLSIRGVHNEHAYPCLDFFKVCSTFEKILSADPTLHGHNHLNTMPNPIWNKQVQPSLSSILGASTTEEQPQPLELQMDLD